MPIGARAALAIGASIFACLASACASVSQQTTISTPIGQSLTAGVGDVILRSESRESLPNVFGKADVFGRTRPAGFATIQFAGMQDGKVVFLRSGVITQSDATTMNSTGLLVSTRESTVYIPPSGSTQTSATQPTIPIIVDWKTIGRAGVGQDHRDRISKRDSAYLPNRRSVTA